MGGKAGQPKSWWRKKRYWPLWGLAVCAALFVLIGVIAVATAPPSTTLASDAGSTSPSISAASTILTTTTTARATTTTAAATTTTTAPPPPTTKATTSAPATVAVITTEHGWPLPDHALTPGQTIAGVTTAQVCTSGWSSRHRDVTETERHQVFASYGIPYSTHDSYELDHLIPLELGGDNAEANLWPERGSIPNPKDALENRLHDLVCSGQVALATAQHAIASNWVAAYATYVSGSPSTTAAPATTATTEAPPTTRAPATTTPAPGLPIVHPGAFCKPAGARGVTDRGTPMECQTASDGRLRWKRAP